MLRGALRVYSLVFESVLCVMGVLLSVFTSLNRNITVEVAWLPFRGPAAPFWVAGLAILGLLLAGLAITGIERFSFWVFSGAVVVILARGLFLSSNYTFSGGGDARNAGLLVLGALLAFVGAWPGRTKRWEASKEKPRFRKA